MKDSSEIRVCNNKKCQKVLPAGYKHRYCEACRNQHAQTAKNVLKGIGAGVGAVATGGAGCCLTGERFSTFCGVGERTVEGAGTVRGAGVVAGTVRGAVAGTARVRDGCIAGRDGTETGRGAEGACTGCRLG